MPITRHCTTISYRFVGRRVSYLRVIHRILLLLIRFYQLAISPYLGCWCRFHPSCSEYARQAILLYGMRQGVWLAIKRLSRCHPFCEGGWDPVPLEQGTRSAELRHSSRAGGETRNNASDILSRKTSGFCETRGVCSLHKLRQRSF